MSGRSAMWRAAQIATPPGKSRPALTAFPDTPPGAPARGCAGFVVPPRRSLKSAGEERRMTAWWRWIAVLCLAAPSSAASAQSVDSFYRDHQLKLVIVTEAGGDYDIWARAIARHM